MAVPENILDYIISIVHEIKNDIFSARYEEAKVKVEAVSELLNRLNESEPTT